jgi:gamma-D-glutamyl-L-lysine dipeptidyl-peptidase
MQYGICLLSLVPVRKEPSGSSEMVTQIQFGEVYEITETLTEWVKVKLIYDLYEGWLSLKQHTRITSNTADLIKKQTNLFTSDLISPIYSKNANMSFQIPMGSFLPLLKENNMIIDSQSFEYKGNFSNSSDKRSVEYLLETAYKFLNAPYLWGGKSFFGIDCSGFVQTVYKICGYKLPRDAYQQVEHGVALSFVEEATAGDLAFFDNEEGRITHVGIIVDNDRIIHASGCVRVDKFDHYGIFNSEIGKYSHHLRVIKRIMQS